jgi:hypothetical protein
MRLRSSLGASLAASLCCAVMVPASVVATTAKHALAIRLRIVMRIVASCAACRVLASVGSVLAAKPSVALATEGSRAIAPRRADLSVLVLYHVAGGGVDG